MRFSITVDDVATDAVADSFDKTLAALVASDSLGYRCRLMSLMIGPADDTPADLNCAFVLKRVDDVSAGDEGTATNADPLPADSLSRAAVIAGEGDFAAEPTTYGNPIWQGDMNRRNTLYKEWSPEDAPVVNRDQLLGLLGAPRTATAATVSVTMEFEEF